ncbi:MAG: arylamine N-acetyltransferase [Rhodospirillaceae bacterium]|nr:arylamine N-acetyltransferase [Rhodospirillaceae bacterium]
MIPLLDAYFARIGYGGGRQPDLAVLASLHRLHPGAIPFENLDPLLGRPVEIAPTAIAAKLIEGKRGGYCFEQNSLFHDVLAALGFSVSPRAGRVIWNAAPDAPRTAMTHRITKVSLPDGDYLADVGFGGQSPTAPLRLVADVEQHTAHGRFRFLQRDGIFELQIHTADGWRGMYRFADEIQGYADFEVANWFTSTHPRSRFRQNLVAARVIGDRRVNLLNTTVTSWSNDGPGETRTLAGPADLEHLLVDIFGLTLPADPQTIWDKLPSA